MVGSILAIGSDSNEETCCRIAPRMPQNSRSTMAKEFLASMCLPYSGCSIRLEWHMLCYLLKTDFQIYMYLTVFEVSSDGGSHRMVIESYEHQNCLDVGLRNLPSCTKALRWPSLSRRKRRRRCPNTSESVIRHPATII